jgi:hypothetical protein
VADYATDLRSAIVTGVMNTEKLWQAKGHYAGTTMTAAFITGPLLTIANVGDSQAMVDLGEPRKGAPGLPGLFVRLPAGVVTPRLLPAVPQATPELLRPFMPLAAEGSQRARSCRALTRSRPPGPHPRRPAGQPTQEVTHSHRIGENKKEQSRMKSAGLIVAPLGTHLQGPAKPGEVGVGPLRIWPGAPGLAAAAGWCCGAARQARSWGRGAGTSSSGAAPCCAPRRLADAQRSRLAALAALAWRRPDPAAALLPLQAASASRAPSATATPAPSSAPCRTCASCSCLCR